MDRDPSTPQYADRSSGGIGKILLIAVAVAALILIVGFATGLLNMSTSGNLEAPKVAVTGGEVPNVDVNAADINVGTKSVTVEVPDVSVQKPADQPQK